MSLAAGEVPDKPRVDIAEQQFSPLRSFSCTGNIVEYPLYLCAGKVSVDEQPRLFLYVVANTGLFKLFTHLCCSSALPDYRIIHGLAGILIPNDGGLALVCNANARNVRG